MTSKFSPELKRFSYKRNSSLEPVWLDGAIVSMQVYTAEDPGSSPGTGNNSSPLHMIFNSSQWAKIKIKK